VASEKNSQHVGASTPNDTTVSYKNGETQREFKILKKVLNDI
jgi:hypothetical protein